MKISTTKAPPMTATNAMIASSKRTWPNRWTASSANDATAVRRADGSSPSPNRICMPIAAPRNSARSVAIAAASAASQSPIRIRRVVFTRIAWGSVMPEAMPSFAERAWMRIAIKFEATRTHNSM
jgi:hypothetical protein